MPKIRDFTKRELKEFYANADENFLGVPAGAMIAARKRKEHGVLEAPTVGSLAWIVQ